MNKKIRAVLNEINMISIQYTRVQIYFFAITFFVFKDYRTNNQVKLLNFIDKKIMGQLGKYKTIKCTITQYVSHL